MKSRLSLLCATLFCLFVFLLPARATTFVVDCTDDANVSTGHADGTPDALTPQQKPTIFVVGDSTARNNGKGAQGWSDPFAAYFDSAKATVLNRAMAGRSTRTYIAEGRWDNVLKELTAGDIMLIQHGAKRRQPD